VTKINAAPSVHGELDNGHYDNRLSVEENEKPSIFYEVWFFLYKQTLPKTFLPHGHSICYSIEFNSFVQMKLFFPKPSSYLLRLDIFDEVCTRQFPVEFLTVFMLALYRHKM
jgi:hypothetical protein